MDPGGDLKTALVRDASLPISGHNILPAIVQKPRSPASIAQVGLALDSFHPSFRCSTGWFQISYLCGDDVELEFLPVVVGLFECLNLESQRQIKNCREQQKK